MRACAAALALLPLLGAALARDDAFPAAKDRALMQWFKAGGGELHQVRLGAAARPPAGVTPPAPYASAAQVVYSVLGADAEQLEDDEAVEAARRGLFAKEALGEGAVAVTLPAKLALTLATSSLPHKSRLRKLAKRRPECGACAHEALLYSASRD